MKIIYKMAFRNIFRKKGRSGLIIIIIALGVFAASFGVSLSNGWSESVYREHIDMQTSHLQIHANNFSDANEVAEFMDKSVVQETLSAVDEVVYASYRLKTNALLSTAYTSVGVILIGVDRDEEIKVSSIHSTIGSDDGGFFESDIVSPIVISKSSAERLNAGINSKIILSLQDSSGEIQRTMFRVGGLYQTNSTRFDNTTAFVKKSDLIPYLNIPEEAIHEVAIVVKDFRQCDEVKHKLSQLLPRYDIKKWDELYPLLHLINAWHGIATFLFLLLFFIALGVSTTNFMMMSVLERKGEFRMLNKVGMAGNRIGLMIIMETLFTTLIAMSIGLSLCVLAAETFSKSGIDIKFLFDNDSRHGYSTVIYPTIDNRDFVHIFVLVSVISVIATLSPIKKVLK